MTASAVAIFSMAAPTTSEWEPTRGCASQAGHLFKRPTPWEIVKYGCYDGCSMYLLVLRGSESKRMLEPYSHDAPSMIRMAFTSPLARDLDLIQGV